MERINCILCGFDATRLILVAKDYNWGTGDFFNLVCCKKCGLVYLSPRPTGEELKRYYPDSNWPRAYFGIETGRCRERTKWNELQRYLLSGLTINRKYGKFLDIGCGDGYLLEDIAKYGWETYGVEPGEFPSQYAREKLGLNVFTGTLEEANFPDDFFDVVNLYHVLEHLANPLSILLEIKRVLKVDGVLFINVPNFRSWEARIFQSYWMALQIPQHLYHFTALSMKQVLKKAGFNVIKTKNISNVGDLMWPLESVLLFLKEHRLYIRKEISGKKPALNSMEDFSIRMHKRPLWKKVLYSALQFFFRWIGLIMDSIGMGENLVIWATKSQGSQR